MGRLSASFAIAVTALGLALAGPASAAKIENQFRTWLEQDLWPDAQAKGVSKKTFDAAFAGVTLNLKLPDLVLPGAKAETPKKQHQAEFGSPGNYFAEKTIGAVTSGGRARAGKNAKTLAAIEKRYGVPGGVVLAIWAANLASARRRSPTMPSRCWAPRPFSPPARRCSARR